MNRRRFLQTLCAGGTGALFSSSLSRSFPLTMNHSRALPDPQVNAFATEAVLNSRHSYHFGYSGTLSDQVLANVLWAVSRAPVMGSSRIIYVARPDNVYRYDPASHELLLHLAGNHLSESSLAFEVGVAGDLAEDAGAALHYGMLASTSFWDDTSSQPAVCPKESAQINANNAWNPDLYVQLVNCYGLMPTVSGITYDVVAHSSDGSLPDPETDGSTLLEEALGGLMYGDQFRTSEPGLDELSQLLWASYGNTPHTTANGRGGLTVASAVANYYLTGRIYLVRPDGVERYHIRLPSGQPSTRDHRIERVTDGDRRQELRAAAAGIPETAPGYIVYCAGTADRWQLLEAGFAAASGLLEAKSLELQGFLTGNFTTDEREAIIAALGIPAGDLPLVVFSAGRRAYPHEKVPQRL
jgi:hypothetical protein